jgi:GT2 family glycosyltransferase
MTPQTDILITTRNVADLAAALVETIKAHTHNYRFLLVDDFSDKPGEKEKIDLLASQHPDCVLLRTHKQRWFTRAVNLGLRLARTPRVVILNADCVVDAGWLDELYAVWAEAEQQIGKVGLVGSVLSAEEPRRWSAVRRGKADFADYVTAHCLLVDMAAISDLSCRRGTPGIYLTELDQRAIHINSDNELSYSLQDLGYATVASFKSAVGHYGGCSWGHRLGEVFALRLEDVNDRYVP